MSHPDHLAGPNKEILHPVVGPVLLRYKTFEQILIPSMEESQPTVVFAGIGANYGWNTKDKVTDQATLSIGNAPVAQFSYKDGVFSISSLHPEALITPIQEWPITPKILQTNEWTMLSGFSSTDTATILPDGFQDGRDCSIQICRTRAGNPTMHIQVPAELMGEQTTMDEVLGIFPSFVWHVASEDPCNHLIFVGRFPGSLYIGVIGTIILVKNQPVRGSRHQFYLNRS